MLARLGKVPRMNARRLRLVACLTTLALTLTMAAAPAGAQSPDASPAAVAGAVPVLDRAAALDLVRAQDPRFAELRDADEITREAARTFNTSLYLESRVGTVPTWATLWLAAYDTFTRTAPSWIVEVVLTDGCVVTDEVFAGEGTFIDPCTWRHAWYYRVQDDGTVTPLFDEGDPDA